jgi:hypothetical protein
MPRLWTLPPTPLLHAQPRVKIPHCPPLTPKSNWTHIQIHHQNGQVQVHPQRSQPPWWTCPLPQHVGIVTVSQVQENLWVWGHRFYRYRYGSQIWHTASYRIPVPWYCRYSMGILWHSEHLFYCFKACFFSYLIIVCHHVTPWCNQIWSCQPRVIFPLRSHSHHSHLASKQSKSHSYILKTD